MNNTTVVQSTITQPRAALYLRQSLLVEEGIDRQKARTAALAHSRGWDVAGEYADNDTSASKDRDATTQWDRMLRDIEAGRVTHVVAVDLDRLLRRIDDLVELTRRGAKVVTVDGEIDLSTADGELRATMLTAMARFEVRRKGERQKRANEHRAKLGKPGGRWVPFGYQADKITPKPDEAEAVRTGMEAYLAGRGFAAIAREWNAAGFRTNRGNEWQAITVKDVMRNPRIIGECWYKNEMVCADAWPAIVTEELFRAVGAKMKAASYQPQNHTNAKHLLTGIARCGVCGGVIRGQYNGKRSYRCARFCLFREAAPLEEHIRNVVLDRLARDDAKDLLVTADAVDLVKLRGEATELRARGAALAALVADGTMTGAEVREAKASINARLDVVQQSLAEVGRQDELAELIGADDMLDMWENHLHVARKRAIISRLVTITLNPSGSGKSAPFEAPFTIVAPK